MAKEHVATKNAATKIMPLPPFPRQSNRDDGNSRDAGSLASSAKNSASPASPAASSSEERTSAIDTPAPAISVTASARHPSGAIGKGGGSTAELRSMPADRTRSTTKLAAAIARPAIENRPNAQRQESV